MDFVQAEKWNKSVGALAERRFEHRNDWVSTLPQIMTSYVLSSGMLPR